MNEGLAELYGAMIGDGCLSQYYSNYDKRQRYCLLLTGHTHDEPYYRKTIRAISIKAFGTKGCIRFRKKDNTVRFEILKKTIFDFIRNFGFPIGLKNNLNIPNKILSKNRLSLACVRGIFDTDGSIYKRYSKKYKNHVRLYDYQVIQFKLKSEQIIKQIKGILNKNNIRTTRIGASMNTFVVRITDQKEIKKFMETVRPSNHYHTERYLNSTNFSKRAGP
jgi:DNA-binding transcriptional regulator WhiA